MVSGRTYFLLIVSWYFVSQNHNYNGCVFKYVSLLGVNYFLRIH